MDVLGGYGPDILNNIEKVFKIYHLKCVQVTFRIFYTVGSYQLNLLMLIIRKAFDAVSRWFFLRVLLRQ